MKLIIAALILVLPTFAFAKPQYVGSAKKHMAEAKCATCHDGAPKKDGKLTDCGKAYNDDAKKDITKWKCEAK